MPEIAAVDAISTDQGEQLKSRIPEQVGKVMWLKKDIAEKVLVKNFDSIKDPTEGQIVMAKMLAKPKNDNPRDTVDLEARPAGYSVFFARAPQSSETLGTNLFLEGAGILTSPVNYDGAVSYVMANKEGVSLIQAQEGYDVDQIMREKFDQVGDQSNNCFVRTAEHEDAHPEKWTGIKILKIENNEAANVLKIASTESLKAPFLSSRDARPPSSFITYDSAAVGETVDLRDIDF